MKWSGIPKILVNEIAHTTFLFREETSSRNSSQTTKFREQGREEGFAHTLHCRCLLCVRFGVHSMTE
jgi:hypothetical protein